MATINAQKIAIAYAHIEETFAEVMGRSFSLKGRKGKARTILVAFFAVGGYDTDRDPDGSLAAFGEYCATCAKDFGRWANASADNWLGYLENRERMRTWQRKRDQVPEIAGKKSKETYSC